MDKILVSLLFVIVGTAAVIGLLEWSNTNKEKAFIQTEKSINTILLENQ
jgi:hypothetical protein